jgi:undecaprenol kinase
LVDKKKSIGFQFAWNGLREVLKSEWNFRLHIVSMVVVIIAGLMFGITLVEWVSVVIVIGLVLTTEILNTAIEEVIDYIKPEIHPAAKKVKDIAAASVFVASMTALVVGLIIFIPRLFA